MIQIDNDDIRRLSSLYFTEVARGSRVPLRFDDFISTTMKSLYSGFAFPKEIKIPRSLEEMIEGDFTPAEIIEMEPPSIDDYPVWRGSTLRDNGVVLRGAGYVNGDSRKPCSIALDDNVPHGLLAGATGHGKSVTLNSIIVTACIEYPPWELQLFLVDAKVVEMKAYGVRHHIPHISSIAATSDAEFIISVLESAYEIMMLRNSVFTKAGAKNIKSFRDQMKLAMPHILIPIDEFQTMFSNAARKAKFINDLIIKVARLGRNTGVHLLMASQELGSDLDKNAMGNIGTRLCLGCLPNTSNQVLGNDEAASNFKQKGRLIINNNPARENNRSENVSLRTPFLPDEAKGCKSIYDYMEILEGLGAKARSAPFHNLAFYDEEARCYEERFAEYVGERSAVNRLYLGEPSFVLNNPDGEPWLRIELKPEIAQNVLIYSPLLVNRERYVKMLAYNLLGMRKRGIQFQCHVYGTNKDFLERTNLGLTSSQKYVREFDAALESALNAALWRRMLVECDEQAFGSVDMVQDDLDDFRNTINSSGEFDSELFQKRAQVLYKMLRTTYSARMGISSIVNSDERMRFLRGGVSNLLRIAKSIGEFQCITLDSFKPQFIFLLGLEQLSGIGVDSKSARVESLRKIVNESPEFKVFFVIASSTMEDCMMLRSTVAHVLCDNLNTSMQSHLKIADFYPDTVSPALGVYYLATAETNKCRKFKKMVFKGEIV